jgi:hypothetical protein
MSELQTIKAVVIVEGNDERDIVSALVEKHKLGGLVIENMEGRGGLMEKAKGFASDSKYEFVNRVGFIYDSEDDPTGASAELNKAEAAITILRPNITISKLQLPSEQEIGSFEAVCLQAIATDDEILKCCEEYLLCLKTKATELTTQARRDKAKLMAWYAAKTGKTISRVGLDFANQKQIDLDHIAFSPIVAFLKKLTS